MSASHSTIRFASVLVSFLGLGVVFAPTGCASQDDEQEAASGTATSALQASSQGGLTDGMLDTEGGLAPEPELAAQTVADRPLRGLHPAGCATKTREANVITLKLDGCSGPFGKVTLRGSLSATFTRAEGDVLHVAIASSDDLTANDRPMTYAAQADVRYEGAQRFVTWHGASSGTTKRGKSFERTTDLSIVADVDTKCATIDGVSKGSVGQLEVNATIEGFNACKDSCPRGGLARATVRGPRGKEKSLDVRFDGSDHAKVKGFSGRSFDVVLDCDAAEAAE
ncbi:MAG TPA: hypothetical protein VLT33_20435 [Labilithrix sp.]|nr:hypothetical protein [Labilithrix sp.]